MLVRITAGSFGIGQVLDLPPAVAKARIHGGTAVLVSTTVLAGPERETAMLDQAERGRSLEKAAGSDIDEPPKRKRGRPPKFIAKLVHRKKS